MGEEPGMDRKDEQTGKIVIVKSCIRFFQSKFIRYPIIYRIPQFHDTARNTPWRGTAI